jgi:hypothetical protein
MKVWSRWCRAASAVVVVVALDVLSKEMPMNRQVVVFGE